MLQPYLSRGINSTYSMHVPTGLPTGKLLALGGSRGGVDHFFNARPEIREIFGKTYGIKNFQLKLPDL